MYKRPFNYSYQLLHLQPKLIIVHAEAEGDFAAFADLAHQSGVKVGVALKPETKPQVIAQALDFIDHVLIFSGNLGHFGGKANTHLLVKVLHLKQLKPNLEIGWDGGVNDKNAATLAAGGVDVLNVGGYIQHAANPAEAYKTLEHTLRTQPQHRR
jgi:ribulose-phosphate 3-epimerase